MLRLNKGRRIILLGILLFTCLCPTIILAQVTTHVFLGIVDDDYANAANWDPTNGYPGDNGFAERIEIRTNCVIPDTVQLSLSDGGGLWVYDQASSTVHFTSYGNVIINPSGGSVNFLNEHSNQKIQIDLRGDVSANGGPINAVDTLYTYANLNVSSAQGGSLNVPHLVNYGIADFSSTGISTNISNYGSLSIENATGKNVYNHPSGVFELNSNIDTVENSGKVILKMNPRIDTYKNTGGGRLSFTSDAPNPYGILFLRNFIDEIGDGLIKLRVSASGNDRINTPKTTPVESTIGGNVEIEVIGDNIIGDCNTFLIFSNKDLAERFDNISFLNSEGIAWNTKYQGFDVILTPYVNSQANHALHFDGIDDNILVEGPIGPIRTIEFRITAPNLDKDDDFLSFLIFPYHEIFFNNVYEDIENETISITNGALTLATDFEFDKEEHHISIVASNGAQYDQIYVDGILRSSIKRPSYPFPDIYDFPTFTIGELWDNRIGFKLDEFRLWSTIRTPGQIAANYNTELTPSDNNGLELYYNFNQGIPNGNNICETSVFDQANGYDGTLRNFSLNDINYSNWVSSSNQEMVEMDGPMIIGSTANANPAPGTIRFNTDNNDFESWNGAFWASMTGWQTGIVTDIDGNVYKTAKIGDQEWMIENLRTTRYRDGTAIPLVEDDSTWSSTTDGAYCYFVNDTTYNSIYGKLYNWYAVATQQLCPTGWKVPFESDWDALTNYLDGEQGAALLMKEVGTHHWIQSSNHVTNSSGFTALPGGSRHMNGADYDVVGRFAFFWALTEGMNTADSGALARRLFYTSDDLLTFVANKNSGLSIRCIKEN